MRCEELDLAEDLFTGASILSLRKAHFEMVSEVSHN